MKNLEKYEIELFGQKFVLSTNDGERNQLKKIVDFYKNIVENLTGKLPNRQHLDIAILAGLKIADKLYSLTNGENFKNFNDEKIHQIVNDAIKRLDISLGL